MAPHDYVLTRLCTTLETRQKAENLYVQATQLTRPGSGHALGAGQAALPAVCAFLASERLGNGDVTQEQARAATSLNEKTFKATLAIVERILPSSSLSANRPTQVTYPSLMQHYGVRADDVVPMREVEDALNSGALRRQQISAKSDLVQCAVFYWVCTRVLEGVPLPDASSFRRKFQLGQTRWSAVHTLLDKHCSHMVEALARNAETAARASVARVTRSQTRKLVFTPSSNNIRLYPEEPTVKVITQKPGINVQTKRKAPPDVGPKVNESPTKRRKDGSYTPSILGRDPNTHTPIARRGNAAAYTTSGRCILDRGAKSLDGDEVEDVPTGTIVVRSTRASRNISDNTAWNAQRPTNVAAKEPCLSTTSLPFTPSNNITSITSTPMTSTGMSDDFSQESPSSVPASRPRSLQRVRLPAVTNCAPLLEDEEMPRRRRRNLRAPFLDRDAYTWKPSARTQQILARARKWEALMIDKYGDPWDAL